jgi:hypothetical protein
MNEAMRLSRFTLLERSFHVKWSAERLGITLAELKVLVEVAVKERERQEAATKAEERRQEQRVEKQREREERKEERQRERDEKQRVADERSEDRARKADQEAVNKAAKEKEKAKTKALAEITKLPVAQHEIKLVQLATKLDLDLSELRAEFAELIKEEKESSEPSLWDVEPWSEPVTTAEVLSELNAKYVKHIDTEPHVILTFALWAMASWVYQDVARHSAFLLLTSADPGAGKTTALEVLNFTVCCVLRSIRRSPDQRFIVSSIR